jgi:hypothetical protein
MAMVTRIGTPSRRKNSTRISSTLVRPSMEHPSQAGIESGLPIVIALLSFYLKGTRLDLENQSGVFPIFGEG